MTAAGKTGPDDRQSTSEGAEGGEAGHRDPHQQGRHSTRWSIAPRTRAKFEAPTGCGNRCGGGTRTVADFTLKWELSHLPPEAQEKAFPLLKKQSEGDFDINTSSTKEDMVIIGTPEECLEKVPAL
jgi:hypothetical protein